jgi:hypothetical protein
MSVTWRRRAAVAMSCFVSRSSSFRCVRCRLRVVQLTCLSGKATRSCQNSCTCCARNTSQSGSSIFAPTKNVRCRSGSREKTNGTAATCALGGLFKGDTGMTEVHASALNGRKRHIAARKSSKFVISNARLRDDESHDLPRTALHGPACTF